MTISLNAVEAVWISLNLAAAVLTVLAIRSAWHDYKAVTELNGPTQRLIAFDSLRDESLRLVVQVLLLVVAVPGLFSAREAQLSPVVVALMAVPLVLLIQSLFGFLVRRRLDRLLP